MDRCHLGQRFSAPCQPALNTSRANAWHTSEQESKNREVRPCLYVCYTYENTSSTSYQKTTVHAELSSSHEMSISVSIKLYKKEAQVAQG
jgi:hypothetical protein